MAISLRNLFGGWSTAVGRAELRDVTWAEGNGGWSEYQDAIAASSGLSLSGERALSQSAAVYACVSLRAETVGSLPLHTFKRLDDRRRERIRSGTGRSQRLARLLNEAPNPEMSAQTFKETIVGHRDLWGNAYIEIVRGADGWPSELWPLRPDRVQVVRDPEVSGLPKVYIYSHPDGRRIRLNADRVMHIPDLTTDGLVGISRITVAREAIGTARAAELHAGKTWRNGAVPSSIVTIPATKGDSGTKEERFKSRVQMYREALNGLYTGTSNAGRIAVIEEGMDWKAAGMSNKDSQFLETRQFETANIAMIYRVPPHMIGLVDRSTSWGCTVPEAKILRADGVEIRADEIRSGDSLLAFDPETGAYLPSTVRAVDRVVKPLVRVTTARGRTIDVTTDHPFWAAEAGYPTKHKELVRSEPEWVRAGDLDPSKHILKVALDYATEPSEQTSAPLAWLAGLVVGDGHVTTKGGSLSIASACPEVTEAVHAVVQDELGATVRENFNGENCLALGVRKGHGETPAAQFIDMLDLRGRHSHEKRVPLAIQGSSDKAIAAFLSGYLDADGTVTSSAVIWGSTSRELLGQVQGLLARLGVQASLRLHQAAHHRVVMGQECDARDMWVLKVGNRAGRARLAGLLNPVEPRKAQRLLTHADGASRAPGFFEFDRVIEVQPILTREAVAIELDAPHTHITAGLVSHNTGIEQQSIGFYTYTIQPILRSIEEACNLRLGLVPGERTLESDGYYTEFQTQALLRGDAKTQAESIALLVQNKILNPEGAAAILNIPFDSERPTEYENPNTSAPDGEAEPEPTPQDEENTRRYEQHLALELAKVSGEARSAKSSVTINAPDIPAPQVNLPDSMDLATPAPVVNVDMEPVARAVKHLEKRFDALAEQLAPVPTKRVVVRDERSNIVEILTVPMDEEEAADG